METMRLSSSSSSSILYSIKKSSLSSYSTFQSTSSSSPFLLSNSRNLVSSWKTVFSSGRMIPAATRRNLSSIVSASNIDGPSEDSPFPAGESFLRNALASMETVYTNRNPTAKAILELVRSADADQICYDHLAYRTFGVNGHGIDSIAKFFLDFGYTQREELRFPAKKLKAFWFSPPASPHVIGGSGVWGPLPRIFISELLVDQMSLQAQEIIRKYTNLSGSGNKHAAFASALGSLTWGKPSHSEFQQLAKESEYAAWTLVNGYAVNHVTVSTHRLKSHLKNIKSLNQFIEENGFKLNSEGGVLKVSPDGLLLQSSTIADSVPFQFCGGITELVPCSYIEFAERLVLPQYKSLPVHEVEEFHRRDGFEVGNADKIFESTSKDQLTRRAA